MTSPEPRRVVIAEDEALIRMDLAEMLAEEGYDVVGQAADGAAAVELAEEQRPDLVILDVKMPVLDGIAAAEQIARAPDRPGRHPDRVLPARAGRAGPRRRRDGLPGQAVHPQRPGARDRDRGQPVRRARGPRDRGRRPRRAAGGPQGRRPGQGRAPEGARADRARRVPLDPEDRDGPAPLDARGRRRRRRARRLRAPDGSAPTGRSRPWARFPADRSQSATTARLPVAEAARLVANRPFRC